MDKSIHTAEYRRLCELLRELRRKSGLTQEQVAKRLGVRQSFVSKYETAERRLDVIELWYVARAIDVPIRTVLERFDQTWLDDQPADSGQVE